jgi:hypothetical protein
VVDTQQKTISQKSLQQASYFATQSKRMVWHNPPKGGASAPDVAHFQSIPLYWGEDDKKRYTFPCCEIPYHRMAFINPKGVTARLLVPDQKDASYPARGLVVEGSVSLTASIVWEIIWEYDQAQTCNLIIQPLTGDVFPDEIRIFVFPRKRKENNFLVTEKLLEEDEMDLLLNNWGGKREVWAFAGVEMGLLTQVEWEPLFKNMIANKQKWGGTLLRLLQKLTLNKGDEDWKEFISICESMDLISQAK